MKWLKDLFKSKPVKKKPGKFVMFVNCSCRWCVPRDGEDGVFAAKQGCCPKCGKAWSKVKNIICRYWFLKNEPIEIETVEHFNLTKKQIKDENEAINRG